MTDKKQQLEDLKSFAGKACIDVFNDFSLDEMKEQPISVQQAWLTGRALANIE